MLRGKASVLSHTSASYFISWTSQRVARMPCLDSAQGVDESWDGRTRKNCYVTAVLTAILVIISVGFVLLGVFWQVRFYYAAGAVGLAFLVTAAVLTRYCVVCISHWKTLDSGPVGSVESGLQIADNWSQARPSATAPSGQKQAIFTHSVPAFVQPTPESRDRQSRKGAPVPSKKTYPPLAMTHTLPI
eukprot:scpid95062/ scgid15168/ 